MHGVDEQAGVPLQPIGDMPLFFPLEGAEQCFWQIVVSIGGSADDITRKCQLVLVVRAPMPGIWSSVALACVSQDGPCATIHVAEVGHRVRVGERGSSIHWAHAWRYFSALTMRKKASGTWSAACSMAFGSRLVRVFAYMF